ncbi:MAG TPA: hypothetical protein VJ841_02700 [Candidatus Saccharimonadales bacterium]|nr:hypothetical protein [Candidatus Saccharimonadales bacterium]
MDHDAIMKDLQSKITVLRDEVRAHAQEVDLAKCAALCETSAEVLTGLETAFEHYRTKSEAVWQD